MYENVSRLYRGCNWILGQRQPCSKEAHWRRIPSGFGGTSSRVPPCRRSGMVDVGDSPWTGLQSSTFTCTSPNFKGILHSFRSVPRVAGVDPRPLRRGVARDCGTLRRVEDHWPPELRSGVGRSFSAWRRAASVAERAATVDPSPAFGTRSGLGAPFSAALRRVLRPAPAARADGN